MFLPGGPQEVVGPLNFLCLQVVMLCYSLQANQHCSMHMKTACIATIVALLLADKQVCSKYFWLYQMAALSDAVTSSKSDALDTTNA